MKNAVMNPRTPGPVIDRPLASVHFRLTVDGWHPIVAIRQPRREHPWQELYDIGIRQVLRLRDAQLEYNPAPLRVLGMVAMQDQIGEEGPDDPEFEEMLVQQAVMLLRGGLRHGGTAIHCVGGRGRSGTVIGGFLHTLGMPPDDIIRLLDRAYKDAGRPGWPESPWQAEVIARIRMNA